MKGERREERGDERERREERGERRKVKEKGCGAYEVSHRVRERSM